MPPAGLYMYVDTRGTPLFARLAATLAFFSLGCQDNPGLEQTETIRGAIVGTPASILAERRPDSGVRWSLPSSFVFRTDAGEAISVVARNYEFTGDYLAVDGIAAESETLVLHPEGRRPEHLWFARPPGDEISPSNTPPPPMGR